MHVTGWKRLSSRERRQIVGARGRDREETLTTEGTFAGMELFYILNVRVAT